MSKIREIMHNNLSGWDNVSKKDSPKIVCEYRYYEEDFDKLETELQELMTNAVNRQYKNALKKIKAGSVRFNKTDDVIGI